jgi:hypothetical protein
VCNRFLGTTSVDFFSILDLNLVRVVRGKKFISGERECWFEIQFDTFLNEIIFIPDKVLDSICWF